MAKCRKPKCFVAMAFDRDDTEELYEKSIKPVLKANDIIPVIINRRQDNRDINNQIIDQLNKCDFAIADLTYTRPSVYFEAGYAQRQVDVIYTVRADHLKKNQPEDKRVHFDLQMKPIIKWTTGDNQSFRTNLERRLKSTVLREFRRLQKAKEKSQMQKDEFAHMSLSDRLIALRGELLRGLYHLNYRFWTIRNLISGSLSYRRDLKKLKQYNWLMSGIREKRLIRFVSLRVEESLTLNKLRKVNRVMNQQWLPHLSASEMVKEKFPVNKTIEHHILCSLKGIPRDRIMSAMPKLNWNSELNCYSVKLHWVGEGIKHSRGQVVGVKLPVERYVFVHVIDDIKSLGEYKTKLENVISSMNKSD